MTWSNDLSGDYHSHGVHRHEHDLGFRAHRHVSHTGKTYFKAELREDGTPVKCEGHASVEMDIIDDWCYAS